MTFKKWLTLPVPMWVLVIWLAIDIITAVVSVFG